MTLPVNNRKPQAHHNSTQVDRLRERAQEAARVLDGLSIDPNYAWKGGVRAALDLAARVIEDASANKLAKAVRKINQRDGRFQRKPKAQLQTEGTVTSIES